MSHLIYCQWTSCKHYLQSVCLMSQLTYYQNAFQALFCISRLLILPYLISVKLLSVIISYLWALRQTCLPTVHSFSDLISRYLVGPYLLSVGPCLLSVGPLKTLFPISWPVGRFYPPPVGRFSGIIYSRQSFCQNSPTISGLLCRHVFVVLMIS
jgi:hypothetical protein